MLSWIKPLLQKEDLRSNTQNSEKEEDGFLVVGQTKSERTTVVTSEFHSDKDGPPTYMDVSGDEPNYSVLSKDYATNQQFGQMAVPDRQHQPFQTGHTLDYSVNSSAIDDVPFCLNPQLKLMWGISNIGMPVHRCFEPSKYDYDFSSEYSLLHSHSD